MDRANIKRHSRRAMIAAVISGSITLLLALLTGVGGVAFDNFNIRHLADAALMYAFAWGFHRQSRASAVLSLAYLVWSKGLLWLDFRRVGALVGLLLFGYFFVQGARAAFAAHRTAAVRPEPPAA